MYRGAMQCILAELVRQDRLVLVEEFAVAAPKTKELLAKLNDLNATRALIVTDAVDENLYLAARNIPHVDVVDATAIDPVSLDRKSTRLNSSHMSESRMPSSA